MRKYQNFEGLLMKKKIYLINDNQNIHGASEFKKIQDVDYKIVDKVIRADIVAVLITNNTYKDPKVMQEINDAKFFKKPVVGFKSSTASLNSAQELKQMGVKFVVKDADSIYAKRSVLDVVLKGKNQGYDLHWI